MSGNLARESTGFYCRAQFFYRVEGCVAPHCVRLSLHAGHHNEQLRTFEWEQYASRRLNTHSRLLERFAFPYG